MLKKTIRMAIRRFGFDVVRLNVGLCPVDFEERHIKIIKTVMPYTITSHERVYSLIEAVRYLLGNRVGGDFVECGVFRGGSMMTIALALLAEGVNDRELYLFDTFEGMPKPGPKDVDILGVPIVEKPSWLSRRISDVSSTWANVSVEKVKQAMSLTNYPAERVHYIKGMVQETVPQEAPASIALLRLDTDWYESIRHELIHLYPRIEPGGVLIVDDYGHFPANKEAVDEFFRKNGIAPFLHRIDYSGRLIVKRS